MREGINLRRLGVRDTRLSLVALAAVLLLVMGCASARRGARPLSEPWVEPFDTAGEWQLDSDATADLEIADGVLSIHVHSPNHVAWAYVERTFTDFRLRVEATPVGGPLDNEYGVLVRMHENEQFYTFSISADGYARVARYDVPNLEQTVLGSDWTLAPAVQQGQATNVLTIEARGPQFKFWVNDELVAEVEDDALSKGGLGLYAGAFSEPGVHVHFDNLRVEPLSASQ